MGDLNAAAFFTQVPTQFFVRYEKNDELGIAGLGIVRHINRFKRQMKRCLDKNVGNYPLHGRERQLDYFAHR